MYILQATFDEICLFMHDYHGGKVVGVLWKPQTLQPKQFKVSWYDLS